MTVPVTTLRAVGLRALVVLIGLWVGATGALTHRLEVTVVGVDWPWGLVLAVLAAGSVAAVCSRLVRIGAAWFGLGWTAALVLQQTTGPYSYLVAGDARGWTFMLLGLGVIAFAVLRAPRLER